MACGHYTVEAIALETKYVLVTNFDITIQLPSNNRHWWVHPERFKDDALQVLHVEGVSKGGWAVGVSKDLIQFIVHSVLDVMVDAEQAEDEAGTSRGGVVTLKYIK